MDKAQSVHQREWKKWMKRGSTKVCTNHPEGTDTLFPNLPNRHTNITIMVLWGHDSQLRLAGGATKRRPPSLEPKQQEETAHEGALLLNLQATQELGRRQTAMEGCSQQTVITADYLRRQVEKAPEFDRMIERKVRVEERKVVQVPPI